MNKRQRKKLAKKLAMKRAMDYFKKEFPFMKIRIYTFKFLKKRKEES